MLIHMIYKQERKVSESSDCCYFNDRIIIIIIIIISWSRFNILQNEKRDTYLTPGQQQIRKTTIATSWQGLRYVFAFILAYLSYFILIGYRFAKPTEAPPEAVVYLGAILMPLLGLFNAITYFWPRYIAHKDTNPNDEILAHWATKCI